LYLTTEALTRSQPLNYWSELQLVIWQGEARSNIDIHKALLAVSQAPQLQLIDAEHDYLTADEKRRSLPVARSHYRLSKSALRGSEERLGRVRQASKVASVSTASLRLSGEEWGGGRS